MGIDKETREGEDEEHWDSNLSATDLLINKILALEKASQGN